MTRLLAALINPLAWAGNRLLATDLSGRVLDRLDAWDTAAADAINGAEGQEGASDAREGTWEALGGSGGTPGRSGGQEAAETEFWWGWA